MDTPPPNIFTIIRYFLKQNTAYVYLTLTILMSVYSQIVVRWRMSSRFANVHLPEGLREKFWFLLTVVFDPFIFSALAATFISGVCWMATMTKLDVSYAYPFTSLVFVLVLAFSHLLLGEPFNAQKLLGVLLIMAGILVSSRG